MSASILHGLEGWLYRRGFSSAPVRKLMAVQILVAAAFLLAGLPLAYWTAWPLCFGLGAGLAASGFWSASRTAQRYTYQTFTRQMALRVFCMFNLRLLGTGIILFILIIKLHTPLPPLLAGLTFTVALIVVWSILKAVSKPIKES